MKELKDERLKNKLKQHACVFTSHSLLFILSGRFRCSDDGMLFYVTEQRHSVDISHRICHETYMAVRISCLEKKFPQIHFHHEIRLQVHVKNTHELQKQSVMSVKVNSWERNRMFILDLCGSSIIYSK